VAGHIPGALNRFFKLNLQENGRFKPPSQLRDEFQALQARNPSGNVVMSCGSGVTACHHILAFELAGLGYAPLYAGSWSEWCSNPQRPVQRGS
jgi:thiosulfate/3-mercaptopyruvate sulfurtransferase